MCEASLAHAAATGARRPQQQKSGPGAKWRVGARRLSCAAVAGCCCRSRDTQTGSCTSMQLRDAPCRLQLRRKKDSRAHVFRRAPAKDATRVSQRTSPVDHVLRCSGVKRRRRARRPRSAWKFPGRSAAVSGAWQIMTGVEVPPRTWTCAARRSVGLASTAARVPKESFCKGFAPPSHGVHACLAAGVEAPRGLWREVASAGCPALRPALWFLRDAGLIAGVGPTIFQQLPKTKTWPGMPSPGAQHPVAAWLSAHGHSSCGPRQ